jgi:hypothetical protein
MQSECSVPSNSLLCSPAQPIKVNCAGRLSSAQERVVGLIAHSLCKNIVMDCSHVQKWRCGIRNRMMGKRKKRTKKE